MVEIDPEFILASDRNFVQSYANTNFEDLVLSKTTQVVGCSLQRLELLDWFYNFVT
jgi:hypothetical protein